MKHDLTLGTWQDDTGCPISIILVTTSDDPKNYDYKYFRQSAANFDYHMDMPVLCCLAGNVGVMLATCRPDSQMSALLAGTALWRQHKTDPDTAFSCWGWPIFTPFFC